VGTNARLHIRLPMGSRLARLGGSKTGTAAFPDGVGVPENQVGVIAIPDGTIGSPADAAVLALRFIGTPYLWGGGSAFGFDCSGLVQFCYAMQGIQLRRDADIQRSDTRFRQVPTDRHECGDLVFFGSDDRITHVGMDLGDGTFVHAAGGTGVIVTPWGDDRFSGAFVDARRMDLDLAQTPPQRHEALDR
jgi:cell wall-associated NlpC family hydrolase